MTRIIGGQRRRPAASGTPPGDSTRPTSDRVREALFSAVDAALGSLDGLRFLDVYAGSGAVGLEARSRGAGVVTLVEHDRRTAALIRENAAHPRLHRRRRASPSPVAPGPRAPAPARRTTWCSSTRRTPCRSTTSRTALAALRDHGWLAPDALVVVERSDPRRRTWPGRRGSPADRVAQVRRDHALVRSRDRP